MILVSLYVLLCFFFSHCNCDLAEKPQNQVAFVDGSTVMFQCRSSERTRLKWFMLNKKDNWTMIFDGYFILEETESFCIVDNEMPGEFNLMVKPIPTVAKTYICEEVYTKDTSSADLIVLNRETYCTINYNNSSIIMTCVIEFWGNWPPDMEWYYNEKLIIENINVSIVPNKSVSTLTVQPSLYNRTYTCRTKFNIKGKPIWTTSDNVPNYTFDSVITIEQYRPDSDEQNVAVISTELVILVSCLLVISIIAGSIFICIKWIKVSQKRERMMELRFIRS